MLLCRDENFITVVFWIFLSDNDNMYIIFYYVVVYINYVFVFISTYCIQTLFDRVDKRLESFSCLSTFCLCPWSFTMYVIAKFYYDSFMILHIAFT